MPRPPRSPAAAALLLALAAAGLAAAAGRRGLAQVAAPPADAAPTSESAVAAPAAEAAADTSIYGSPETDACIAVTNKAGQACTVEADTSSEEAPTPKQISDAINNMKAAAQPSQSCCSEFKPFADARCPCDPGFQQILPIGGFDPVYFEGATAILSQACGYDFSPCQPCEHAQTENVKQGGR